MNGRDIGTIYRKELKDSLRDRRTLMSTILIPTLVMPALLFGVGRIASTVVARAQEEVPAVVVLGGADSPGVMALLKKSGRFHVVPGSADWRRMISDKKIRAAVEIPPGFEAGLNSGAAPAVTIYHYQGELKSGIAVDRLDAFFVRVRDRTVEARLAEHGLPATLANPFATRHANVAPPEKVGGNLVGGIIPYLIIVLCFTGAMYPGIDLTAGEKERGTMEALLCSPVSRLDIVLGKFLMVLTGSLAAMGFSLISLCGSLAVLGSVAGAGTRGRSMPAGDVLPVVDPAGVLGVLAMIAPVAVLFSAIIFTVALFAKSYKEAQSYVAPMVFIVILPAVVGMLPGIDLNARLAFVPILNLSLVCKEMLSGVWNWNYIAIVFVSTCAYAAAALALAVRMFKREDVIFRA